MLKSTRLSWPLDTSSLLGRWTLEGRCLVSLSAKRFCVSELRRELTNRGGQLKTLLDCWSLLTTVNRCQVFQGSSIL